MKEKKGFLQGGVKVVIYGIARERFFNIAAQRELMLWEVKEEDKENGEIVTFWTTSADFKKMKPIAKKAGVRLRIKDRFGLPFFLHRNRKRKLLACGLGSFFLLLYILSFFIWDISFEGNQRFTDEMLLHYMETIPVVCGMKKMKISCEAIESGIRNRFTEITWVSAEIKGTRLVVRVKENEALLTPVVDDDMPCDLAAEKSGKIVRMVVRSGFSQVKAGEDVEAGTLLVDGTVPIFDDSGTIVNSHEVHADAEIYAETIHGFQKTLPWTEIIRSKTGTVRNGFFFKIFDRTFYLMMPDPGDSLWEYMTEQEQIHILENFYLPLYWGRLYAYEYVPYEKTYTEEEMKCICDGYLQEYMEKLMEKGIQILGSDGKIEKGASGWQIQGTLKVIEDIAKEIPVEMPQSQ